MNKIKIRGRIFEEFLNEEEILEKVKEIARQIENENRGKDILFLSILNGAYVFTADLLRNINLNVKVTFLKMSSYSGDKSTGKIRRLIGLNEQLHNLTVIILEDIIDTGLTLEGVIEDIKARGAKDIRIAALLFKPDAYKGSHRIDYLGFEIPNDFVIGYGLDFDGLGRNLRSVYRIVDENTNK